MTRRSSIIYGLLAFAWLAILGWQILEHTRVKAAARTAVVNRARAIAETLEVVILSQRRFGNVVNQERLESALSELAKAGEPKSVALLNAAGAIVASAGDPIPLEVLSAQSGSEYWDEHGVTLVNLVDLGTNVVQEGQSSRPIIVLPRRDSSTGTNTDWRAQPRSWWRSNRGATNATNVAGVSVPPGDTPPGDSGSPSTGEGRPPRDSFRRPPFGRPPWMSEEEFKTLIEKQGLHSFVMVMSTGALRTATANDLWLRGIIGLLGAVAAGGLALAWRNVEKSSDLQLRLLRASELNKHLKEMNIAAAGLAHETRNPLNIVRGMAQLISKEPEASPEIRTKSREIIHETDRVTAQLNEFINYSRPREVRRTAVALPAVVGEVARALTYDLEEKCVRLRVPNDLPVIEADEQLFRQAFFNLLLNAVQAVERGGDIEIVTRKSNSHEAALEIRDNGPGVPLDQRSEIFKPYFTTHQKGTGLGLAVVQQIVLAHGWEIECLSNDPRGAVFRISHLKLASGA